MGLGMVLHSKYTLREKSKCKKSSSLLFPSVNHTFESDRSESVLINPHDILNKSKISYLHRKCMLLGKPKCMLLGQPKCMLLGQPKCMLLGQPNMSTCRVAREAFFSVEACRSRGQGSRSLGVRSRADGPVLSTRDPTPRKQARDHM